VSAPPRSFAQLFSALLRSFHPRHAKRPGESNATAALSAQLRKVIPYSVTKRLVALFTEQADITWSTVRWRQAVLMTANRAGLLVSGDLEASLSIVAAELGLKLDLPADADRLPALLAEQPMLRDLLVFATSPTYLALRAKLMGST
jgi:hypothetical protein